MDRRPLPLRELAGPWFRLHRLEYQPLFFGRVRCSRFDAPGGEYVVLSCGSDTHCAFIETFGQATTLGLIDLSELRAYGLARLEGRRPLRLVDLTGPGLARLGADERLCAGDERVAQRRALALWRRPAHPDGLWYRARHDPSRLSAAVFDRAADALTTAPLGSLADPAKRPLLVELLDTYGLGLLDSHV